MHKILREMLPFLDRYIGVAEVDELCVDLPYGYWVSVRPEVRDVDAMDDHMENLVKSFVHDLKMGYAGADEVLEELHTLCKMTPIMPVSLLAEYRNRKQSFMTPDIEQMVEDDDDCPVDMIAEDYISQYEKFSRSILIEDLGDGRKLKREESIKIPRRVFSRISDLIGVSVHLEQLIGLNATTDATDYYARCIKYNMGFYTTLWDWHHGSERAQLEATRKLYLSQALDELLAL